MYILIYNEDCFKEFFYVKFCRSIVEVGGNVFLIWKFVLVFFLQKILNRFGVVEEFVNQFSVMIFKIIKKEVNRDKN